MVKDKTILIKNVYYMLAYAFKTLKDNSLEKIESEDFEYIHDLFASILAKGVAKQIKRGLYKDYIIKQDDITTVRGKIDISNTMKHMMKKQRIISCEYDELTHNNILNQIIKTTLLLLLRQKTVTKEHKNEIKRVLFYLSDVDEVDVHLIRWNTLNYQKNNSNYRLLINICYFVLDGLLMSDGKGNQLMQTFLKDDHMNLLYEHFVLEFYKYHYPDIRVSAPEVKWNIDDETYDILLPKMQTDIVLSKGDKELIIDTKYYSKTLTSNYDSRKHISSNLYQIFTYVKNEDVGNKGNVSGLLLYAKTDEDIEASSDYDMSGNTISIRVLDLYKDFSVIKDQLDLIKINLL